VAGKSSEASSVVSSTVMVRAGRVRSAVPAERYAAAALGRCGGDRATNGRHPVWKVSTAAASIFTKTGRAVSVITVMDGKQKREMPRKAVLYFPQHGMNVYLQTFSDERSEFTASRVKESAHAQLLRKVVTS